MPTLEQYYGNTSDVVFVPGQGYMTQSQQQDQIDAERERRALVRQEEAARLAQTSSPDSRADLPQQPRTAPVPVTIPERLQQAQMPNPSAPSWWISNAYVNPTAEQAFANAANAILPDLSPEDQRQLGTYLATNFRDVYGGYANAPFSPIPFDLTNQRETYFDPQRARAALERLDRVQQVSGGEMGRGYDYLRQALNMLNRYSTTGQPMTREQYELFANAVRDMTSMAGSDISAYSNLAQMFNLPGFTAGQPFSNAPIPRLNT